MDKRVKLIGLISVIAIVAVYGALAIPAFLFTIKANISPVMGYQFIFNAYPDRFSNNHHIAGPSVLGIVALSLLLIALAMHVLARKSSAFLLLGGLLNVATSIMFFAMEASKNHVFGTDRSMVTLSPITYIIGAVLVITGLLSLYVAFKSMKSERKELSSKKSYSYLKK